MKFNLLLFFVLPLFYHCNTNGYNHKHTSSSHDQNTSPASPDSLKTVNVSGNKNPFGILIDKTDNTGLDIGKKILVAKSLGINYIRLRVNISDWNGTINNYTDFTNAGFKIVLNINYAVPRTATGEKQAIPFPTDLQSYSKTLNEILDKYKPELVVIENEEDNSFYHSGTAGDYINELKTAIDICHAKGLKVTNGGLTVREMTVLVYDDLMLNGKTQEAQTFAQRAFPQFYLSKLDKYPNAPVVKRALDFGRTAMQAYKTLNLDYVNFHWYEPITARGKNDNGAKNNNDIDPTAFNAVVNLLTKITGKPVITNEFGVMNISPTLITQLMQLVLKAKMDYAIFYSGDGAGGAVALQNGDGSLRQTGTAVRDFIKQNCQ